MLECVDKYLRRVSLEQPHFRANGVSNFMRLDLDGLRRRSHNDMLIVEMRFNQRSVQKMTLINATITKSLVVHINRRVYRRWR